MDQKTTSSSQPIRVIELFAGVGGFRLGFEGYNAKGMTLPSAGPFTTVWANQWEPPGNRWPPVRGTLLPGTFRRRSKPRKPRHPRRT